MISARSFALSNRPFFKVAGVIGMLLVSFWIASYFPDLLISLIVSGLTAFVLRPFVTFLEYRTGMRRTYAVLLVFLLFSAILFLIGYYAIPMLIHAAESIYDQFKNFPFQARLDDAARDISKTIPFLKPETISAKVNAVVASAIASLASMAQLMVSLVFALAIVPFITFFILSEGDRAFKNLIERVPNKYFEMTLNIINKISKDLVGYLRGWLLDSFFIGLLSISGMYIIGIDYPIIIGVIAGVANLVPYLGPPAGAIPAFLISLIQYGDFRMALPIAIVTIAVQAIDNMIVQPMCFAKTVDMHPITVIIVLVVGNELMGVAGMLLAIPIATILKVSAMEAFWGLKHYRITA